MTSVRQSNFELLRIIAIMFIMLMHTYGMANPKELSVTNELIGRLINAVGNTGVTCFILISGYFGIRFNASKFVHLIYLATLYTLVATLPALVYDSRVGILNALFMIPLYSNWFITCYLILMLLSGYLNRFAESLDRSAFIRLLGILTAVLCILPTVLNHHGNIVVGDNGKSLIYILFTYLIGRFIRLHADIRFAKLNLMTTFIVSTATIIIVGYLAPSYKHTLYHDNSILILLSSLCLFYWIKAVPFRSKIINWVSGSVLALFLLDLLRLPLNHYLFGIEHLSKRPELLPQVLLLIGLYCAIVLVIDKWRAHFLSAHEDKGIARLFVWGRWARFRLSEWVRNM